MASGVPPFAKYVEPSAASNVPMNRISAVEPSVTAHVSVIWTSCPVNDTGASSPTQPAELPYQVSPKTFALGSGEAASQSVSPVLSASQMALPSSFEVALTAARIAVGKAISH